MNKPTPWLLAASFVIGIFSLHTLWPSLIAGPHPALWRVDSGFLQEIWQLHTAHPAFAGRPLTSLSISLLHYHLGIPFGWSFVYVNFTLLFFCGLLIYYTARKLELTEKQSLLSILIFYTSFTILFAFFRSIDTYDDPWQYILILSSLYFVLKKQWWPLAPLLFLAFLARETTAFLIPGVLYLVSRKTHSITPYLLLLTPLFAYLLAEPLILGHYGLLAASRAYTEQTRFTHWQFNFQSWQFAIETLVSLALVIAPAKLLIWHHSRHHELSTIEKYLITAAIITLTINTPIVLFAGRAREARLFALPLLFVWPLLGKYAQSLWQNMQIRTRHISRLLFISCLLFLAVVFSFVVYKPTFSAGFDFGFQLYCFITLTVLGIACLCTRRT